MAERTELAEFLRARRNRLTPAEVGLPVHGRRRTPGLRREEVATLAGVSIDYLVRLEQGRDTNPSAEVIAALATALRLSEAERMHLGHLAAREKAPGLCRAAGTLTPDVRPTVQALLDRLDPTPSFVLGPANDLLAWNDSWTALMGDTGLLDGTPPNVPRFVFLDPRARDLYTDWDAVADEQAGQLRWARPRWGDDPRFAELVDDLLGIPEFASRWEAHAVDEKGPGTKAIRHPDLGELRVAYEVLILADDGQRLVSWLGADARTDAVLTGLVEAPVSPAKLRVVGEP